MALYKGNTKLSGIGGAFTPEHPGQTGQVLKKTATGYDWDNDNDTNENVFVTQTEYNNLPSSKLTDGKTYFIYSTS